MNLFYRQVFQDILDYDGKGLSIEDHIVRRVRGPEMVVPWLDFLNLWNKRDDRDKIQHVMDRVGAVVTEVVFGRWNKIFREDAKGKEVVISFDVVHGEKTDAKGVVTKTDAHDIYVKFQIRDGTRRFDVNARSLGFRWFFAFMLFTQFRVARNSTRPIFFLFDEPASNLHAAAQQKLIESFPEIAKGPHTLVYTTHSHYMIEPKWLEQTFIVTNRSDGPPSSVLEALSLDDESLDVKAWSYRSFVDEYPSQTSYFQPILDRLEIVPSRFDITRSSVIVEGRSDYNILRYAAILHGQDIALVPGLGAGTFGALVALHVGWNIKTLFLLDGDKQGKAERDKYVKEYGLPSDRAMTIDELYAGLTEIEDVLDPGAIKLIESALGLSQAPKKGQIKRFFQERIAADQVVPLGSEFSKRSKAILNKLKEHLG